MWKQLNTIGKYGSENGLIVLDEQCNLGSRITLERCEAYDAITVGIYGSMAHTVFYDKDISQKRYEEIKKDIQDFLEKETTEIEALQFYEYFTRKY